MPDTKKIQPLLRAASFIPSSFNEADNTIELVAATEAEVLVYNWEYGRSHEILSMQAAHVRLDRLNSGANVLDNHNSYGSVRKEVLGVVENARLEKGQLIVKIRFSGRADLKEFVDDVKNGIYPNVSIQYRIYKAEVTEEEGKLPVIRAIDWEPFEVSFVSVPADYNAGARSQQKDIATNEVELIHTRNSNSNNMKRSSEILKLVRAAGLSIDFAQTLIDDESIDIDKARNMIEAEKLRAAGSGQPAPAQQAPASAQPAASEDANAGKAERKRSSEIINAVRSAGFDLAYAETLINDDKMTVDGARAAIIAKLGQEDTSKPPTRSATQVLTVGADETDKRRAAMVDGLVLRSAQVAESKLKPEAVSAAREFRGLTLLDYAKDCLQRAGINTAGMDKMQIAARAMSSTSDFPILLEGTTRRVLLENYTAAADTWKRFCAIGSVGDFREHKRLRMGSFTKLDKVGENSEFQNKKITDADAESASIDTYGNLINISRKMIVNDDLNGFARLTSMLGRAAARSVEIDVYALLASNPNLADGVALFHATHNNIITAAAPSVASFDAMRVKMAQQKDKDSNEILDLRPSVLVIGVAQGGEARVINDAQYDPDTANKLQRPNKVRGLFKDIVDTARITGTEMYAFADPSEEPVIEVNFLDGVQTPFLDSETEFKTDGIAWKVRLDYGVDAIGYRGAVKNAGV